MRIKADSYVMNLPKLSVIVRTKLSDRAGNPESGWFYTGGIASSKPSILLAATNKSKL